MISPALLALALGPALVLAVAEAVPVYDVAPGCRAAVTVVPESESGRRTFIATRGEPAAPGRHPCSFR